MKDKGPDEAFQRALVEFDAMQWRSNLTTSEVGSPQRIAPHCVAIEAELTREDEILSSGRLILLHDPRGNKAWLGKFRLVSYVRAEVELEMVADPLLPEVAWSWFSDALENHGCQCEAQAGTVTASYGRGFGAMSNSERAELEIRCSWTPLLGDTLPVTPHLAAWQDLIGHVAGEPPLPPGVAILPRSHLA